MGHFILLYLLLVLVQTSELLLTHLVTHLVDGSTLNVTVVVQTWSASLVSDKCQYELV